MDDSRVRQFEGVKRLEACVVGEVVSHSQRLVRDGRFCNGQSQADLRVENSAIGIQSLERFKITVRRVKKATSDGLHRGSG